MSDIATCFWIFWFTLSDSTIKCGSTKTVRVYKGQFYVQFCNGSIYLKLP